MASDRDESTSTSVNSAVEDEQAPPPAQSRWTKPATPIQPPIRSLQSRSMLPTTINRRPQTDHVVAAWASGSERVKVSKREHGEDASSNLRRRSTGKQSEPIVLDDDDEPQQQAGPSTKLTRDILGVQPKAPFGSNHVNGALETDPIAGSDSESLEIVTDINGDKNTRYTTPTRYPIGNVKKKAALFDKIFAPPSVPVHDFSIKSKSKVGGLKSRMKPNVQKVDGAVANRLIKGKNASDVTLRPRPSDPSAEPSSSRFGSAMPTTLHYEDDVHEQQIRRRRTEKFGPVTDDNARLLQAGAKTNGHIIATPPGAHGKPKYGPAPLEAFCLGTQRALEGTYFAGWTGGVLAFFDDAVMSCCVAYVTREELESIEAVNQTDAKRASSGGGAIIRLKPTVKRLNSSAFESADQGPVGCIVLKFATPTTSSWTVPQRDQILDFLARVSPSGGFDHIPVSALDSLIENSRLDEVNIPSEIESEDVAEQARLLQAIKATGERKEKQKLLLESQRAGDRGIASFLTKGKGKSEKVVAPLEISHTTLSSARKRARGASDDDELEDVDRDELDLLGQHDLLSAHSAGSGDNDDPKPWDRRRESKRSTRSSARYSRASSSPRPSSSEGTAKAKREPLKNPDEIILVFPKAGPGAINISRGDYARLEPGEFLNDTLIEFWLKYWLTTLDPALAEQVHVFSSFFYKKLNQRNFDEGYASVRKWTNKVDIFKKKFIIVPINEHIHWYLAIIYQPEHVLKPPIAARVATRQHVARLAEEDVGRVHATEEATRELSDPDAAPKERSQSQERVVSAEEPVPPSDGDTQLDEIPMDVDDTASVATRMEHYSIEDLDDDANVGVDPVLRAMNADGTPIPDELSRDRRSVSLGSGLPPPPIERADEIEVEEAIAPEPLQSVLSVDDTSPGTSSQARPSDGLDEQIGQTTYIFTFDSLGSKHPQVIKNLSRYLAADAQDKRGIPAAKCSAAQGKKVTVPTQPNYCDCGVYLLHFAETFMSDPARYVRAIMSPPKKPPIDKNELWRNEAVGTKRDYMANKVMELSTFWQQMKQQGGERLKEDAKPALTENVEDDDDVVCEIPATSKPAKKTTLRAGRTGALD